MIEIGNPSAELFDWLTIHVGPINEWFSKDHLYYKGRGWRIIGEDFQYFSSNGTKLYATRWWLSFDNKEVLTYYMLSYK